MRFWLALAGRPGEVTSVLVGPVVEVAERLLRLVDLARDVRVMEDRVRRGELLNDLLDEQRAREVSPERLELFGFAKGPWRVALLAVGPGHDEALRLVGDAAASTGTPHLLGLHHGHVALVLEGAAPAKRVSLELGNNAPVIVEPDGDWQAAAAKVAVAGFAYLLGADLHLRAAALRAPLRARRSRPSTPPRR